MRLRSAAPLLVGLNLAMAAWLLGGAPSYHGTPAFPEPRASVCLSGVWSHYGAHMAPTPWKRVRVPEVFDPDAIDREAGWYQRWIYVPKPWRWRGRVVLRFDKVQHSARVSVNGRWIGEHFGNRVGFEADATDAVTFGGWNQVRVRVESLATGRAWPGVFATDPAEVRFYTTNVHRPADAWIGGDVWLLLRPTVRVEEPQVVTSVKQGSIRVRVTVRNDSSEPVQTRLWPQVRHAGKAVVSLPSTRVSLQPFGTAVVESWTRWDDAVPWGPPGYGERRMYTLVADLRTPLGALVDRTRVRFGFRELDFDGQHLTLNGKRLFIAGLRVGEEARRASARERHGLRRVFGAWMDLGYNAVESHVESRLDSFYDVADETGMMVISGNFCSGMVLDRGLGENVQSTSMAQLPGTMAQWVAHERNHPSIVMWNACDLSEQWHPVLFAEIPREDASRLIPWDSFQLFQADIDDRYRITDEQRIPYLDGTIRKPAFVAETYSPRNEPSDPTAVRMAYVREVERRGYFGVILPPDARACAEAVAGVEWPSSAGPDPRGDRVSVRPAVRAGTVVAPPELSVRVSAGGRSVPHPMVMALPLAGADGGPVGVMGDEHGRALLYLPTPGRWRVLWVDDGVRVSADVDAPATVLPVEGPPAFQEVHLRAPADAYAGGRPPVVGRVGSGRPPVVRAGRQPDV